MLKDAKERESKVLSSTFFKNLKFVTLNIEREKKRDTKTGPRLCHSFIHSFIHPRAFIAHRSLTRHRSKNALLLLSLLLLLLCTQGEETKMTELDIDDDEKAATPTPTPKTPGTSSKQQPAKPRLVIKSMVLENFKSYAGAQHVGPFHKVSVMHLFCCFYSTSSFVLFLSVSE